MKQTESVSTRRGILKVAGTLSAGWMGGAMLSAAQGAPTAKETRQDSVQRDDGGATTADILVETLIRWQVPLVFGIVGDGINSIIEALRKREDQIRFIAVRHEEAAAFMASGYAKHTGRLGVCLATTGPGAIHLMNGLYDAKMDSAPVLAITGSTFHDLGGTHFMQAVDTTALLQGVALYNVSVSGPIHAAIVGNLCGGRRLAKRGVAHLTVAKDVQAMRLSADKASMENHGLRTLQALKDTHPVPDPDALHQAAAILNDGRKIAILVGQGALHAREEITPTGADPQGPGCQSLTR